MSHRIDPESTYRIRSRGVEQPAVLGYRLPQMVRDFVVAQHDELSEDGDYWFTAGEVETLFPSAASERLIRERLHRDPAEPSAHVQVEDARKFPREPWYVARASNVAGPYDQLTIASWYEEGSLFDDDQLRPGLHASWRPLGEAAQEGLLRPPPVNTCSANPHHLVADPPVWMGPPRVRESVVTETTVNPAPSSQASNSNLAVALTTAGAAVIVTALLLFGWLLISRDRREAEPVSASPPINDPIIDPNTASMGAIPEP